MAIKNQNANLKNVAIIMDGNGRWARKNSLKISICDNGNGIPKELIDKIFLPFYSTKKRGSGIGLFLVKRIIDDHEGTIALESQEGVTTAQIILPF